jgi:twitching motility protein PilT
MANIDAYFEKMLEEGASDLHISVGVPVRIRVNGDLYPIQEEPLSAETAAELIGEILSDAQREHFEKTRDLDLAYQLGDGQARFRCNIFEQHRGLGGVFRVIPSKIRSVEELGLPQTLLKFCGLYKGLVLVTGATGSGKSTTLAAMVDYINRTEKQHILTVEDPVEFVHTDKGCLINQREVGHHTQSFASALRAALREDPDVILVGEMRDLETIELAITAAETGHLVFGTLHTTSAAKTMDRIINVFPTNQQEQIRAMLAESLQGVVCQYLLKTANGKGRVAALEILTGTPAVSSLIREGKTYQIPSVLQTGKKMGMQTMDQALATLVKAGKVTREAAVACATTEESFDRALQGQQEAAPERRGPVPGEGSMAEKPKDAQMMARAKMGGK